MPSTYSVSKAIVFDSSTVMTPSLPTLSITSAIRSPISGSAALMVATWAISSRPLTGWRRRAVRLDDGLGGLVDARFICIGLAPAATFLSPR
jgi:hypothetical protein